MTMKKVLCALPTAEKRINLCRRDGKRDSRRYWRIVIGPSSGRCLSLCWMLSVSENMYICDKVGFIPGRKERKVSAQHVTGTDSAA
jgi:hypothetical protein